MTNNENETVQNPEAKRWATIVYLFQAISIVTYGVSFIAGFIINYLKRSDVKGTWVESHFEWQVKTFWYTAALLLISLLTLSLVIGPFIFYITVFWVVFRIVYGWNRLSQGKPVPRRGFFF